MNRIFTALLMTGALAGAADFSYVEQTSITGGAMVKMAAMMGRLAKGMSDPVTTTHSYSGNKKASVSAKRHEILDLDAGTITTINDAKQEYSVATFAEMAELTKAMAAKTAGRGPNADTKWKATFTKSDKTRQIAGITANGGTLRLDIEATEQQTNKAAAVRMDIDLWMGKVPGWDVKRDFDKQAGEKMGTQMGEMPAISQGGAGVMDAMKDAGRQLSQLGDMQLGNVHKVYSNGVPGSSETGPALLSESTTEVVSFSNKVDPAVFQVPAGFKQVEHPIKKGLERLKSK
jgi:hypothetical protein